MNARLARSPHFARARLSAAFSRSTLTRSYFSHSQKPASSLWARRDGLLLLLLLNKDGINRWENDQLVVQEMIGEIPQPFPQKTDKIGHRALIDVNQKKNEITFGFQLFQLDAFFHH